MSSFSIIPLGTVSPFCYDGHMCPGFLVKYHDQNILMDCGNGVTNYLQPEDYQNMTIIISHLHPDHYGDLLSIAQLSYVFHRLGYLNHQIQVYVPAGDVIHTDESYIDEAGWGASRSVTKHLIDYDFVMNLESIGFLKVVPYKQNQKIKFDDLEVSFSKNPHPLTTYSIRLQDSSCKVAYSSDTGYLKNTLATFAKDANLLICESTFLKGQVKSSDTHLFAFEAGMIARDANVHQLLLTHFWPLISKEQYVMEARGVFSNTEAAEEGKKLILK